MLPTLIANVLWNANPEVFNTLGIDAGYDLRWYGLLFATGFLLGQMIITYIFKLEGKPAKDVETITLVMVLATVVGARLGHCLGYEPEYYLKHPLEILYVWKGGLASHGATIGIILGIWFYSRKRPGQSFLWTLDRIVIVVALGGALIRMGNLINSEIVGKPANLPWSFVFTRPATDMLARQYGDYISSIDWERTDSLPKQELNGVQLQPLKLTYTIEKGRLPEPTVEMMTKAGIAQDFMASSEVLEHISVNPAALHASIQEMDGNYVCSLLVYGIPRHPAQIYESISTFLLFVLLFGLWLKQKDRTKEGSLFAIFVVVLFSLRIFYEFLKENQVASEASMALNYGQLYSIPLVVVGVVLLLWLYRPIVK